MRRTGVFIAAAAFLATASAVERTHAASAPSSLSETYEDWLVACVAAGENGKQQCTFSQSQASQNGQRVLTIELSPTADGGLKGTLTMPFGLNLDKGVTFSVNNMPPGKPTRFTTCLPVGCIARMTLTPATVALLRQGTALKLGTFASDSEKEVAFSISLKGFGTALDRTAALGK